MKKSSPYFSTASVHLSFSIFFPSFIIYDLVITEYQVRSIGKESKGRYNSGERNEEWSRYNDRMDKN